MIQNGIVEPEKEESKGGEMTLDEAIKHCEDKISDTPCGRDHRQLRNWLVELKHFKNDK